MFSFLTFFLFSFSAVHVKTDENIKIIENDSETNQSFTGVRLDKIKGDLKFVEIDSDSNIYIATVSDDLNNFTRKWRFYKLNSKREIVMESANLKNVEKVIMADNKIYIFCAPYGISIYLLEPNAVKLKKIYEYLQYPAPAVYFSDNTGNIFFNTAHGVAILKNGETTPKGIINLDNFYITDESSHAVDTNNNVYLSGTIEYSMPKFAIITSDQIKSFAPSAQLHDYESNPILYFGKKVFTIPESIISDDKGHMILKYNGNQAKITITGNDWNRKVLLSQYYTDFNILGLTNGIIYFFSRNIYNNECYLNLGHMTYDENNYGLYKINKIDEMFGSSFCSRTLYTFDNDGNLYLASESEGYLLRKEESKIKKMDFPSKSKMISMVPDQNGGMWILGTELYKIEKNSVKVKQVTNSTLAKGHGILKMNKDSDELFVGSDKGFHVFSK